MIPISSAITGELTWSKIAHKRGFELRSDAGIVASLRQTSFWSREFQAESAHGSWRFRRSGFWRIATEIVDAASGVRIAALKPNWCGGGMLIFTDGQTFQLTSKGFWRPVWSALANGQSVLSVQTRGKKVELLNQMHLPEERLTLLAIFTWHIMRQAAEDGAEVAAAIS
jgi:hypothetical protein